MNETTRLPYHPMLRSGKPAPLVLNMSEAADLMGMKNVKSLARFRAKYGVPRMVLISRSGSFHLRDVLDVIDQVFAGELEVTDGDDEPATGGNAVA
jgi:hypothetical protein